MSRAMRVGRLVTVVGLFLALFAAVTGVAGASTPARPPLPVPLAEITGGSSYRVVYAGEAPEGWHAVGDETSTTVEPGARVEVRGWWSACSVRDAGGVVLVEDAGVFAASCEVPPAGPVVRTAAPAVVGPGAELRVAPDGPAAGYSREAFGDGWAPTAPGCDTRDVVLARDLTGETVRHGCDVVAGTLRDPYTGRTVTGPARALDVDHLVPLALAWRTGAAGWTAAERERFANDPANLRATVAAGNRAKGDAGPEEWLPAVDHCGYARAFAAVVERYRLTVTAARRDAIEGRPACRADLELGFWESPGSWQAEGAPVRSRRAARHRRSGSGTGRSTPQQLASAGWTSPRTSTRSWPNITAWPVPTARPLADSSHSLPTSGARTPHEALTQQTTRPLGRRRVVAAIRFRERSVGAWPSGFPDSETAN